MECNGHSQNAKSADLQDTRRQFIEDSMKTSIQTPKSAQDDESSSFFVADLGEVYRQHSRWQKSLPKIKPYYAVKCNPDQEVVRLLALLGNGFDCSSPGEIQQVLSLGVTPDRIIYANPYKSRSALRYAQRMGIKRMTFDSADELHKIKAIQPEAELILRIAVDDSSSANVLSHKFGAPLCSVKRLCTVAKSLGLNLVGISFHVGSGAKDPQVFTQAIRDARVATDQAREAGHSPWILDVGGGFSSKTLGIMSQALLIALDECFPKNFDLIAEPGRYFVESAFTLACNIIARRCIGEDAGNLMYMLYLNDGVYGNFMDCLLSEWQPEPHILFSASQQCSDEPMKYAIWGRTCCGVDRIVDSQDFDRSLDIGDWLYFEGMGAYSLCLSSSFNGYPNEQIVHHVCSEAAAKTLLDQ